jgi:hypothetical protein
MARRGSKEISPGAVIAGGILLLIFLAVATLVVLQGPPPEAPASQEQEKPVDPFEGLSPERPLSEK